MAVAVTLPFTRTSSSPRMPLTENSDSPTADSTRVCRRAPGSTPLTFPSEVMQRCTVPVLTATTCPAHFPPALSDLVVQYWKVAPLPSGSEPLLHSLSVVFFSLPLTHSSFSG